MSGLVKGSVVVTLVSLIGVSIGLGLSLVLDPGWLLVGGTLLALVSILVGLVLILS